MTIVSFDLECLSEWTDGAGLDDLIDFVEAIEGEK